MHGNQWFSSLLFYDDATGAANSGVVVWVLGGSGVLLLATTLVQSSVWEGFPLSQLGQRPKGRGLASYLYHCIKEPPPSNNRPSRNGVWGYDPVQGAQSPVLRCLCHVSAVLMGSAAVVRMMTATSTSTVDSISSSTIPAAADSPTMKAATTLAIVATTATAVFYTVALYLWHVLHPGVSHPGGPRPHRSRRVPQWEARDWSLPNTTSSSSVQYLCGAAGHAASERAFAGTSAGLTGEPAGRDVWMVGVTTGGSGSRAKITDQAKALASGERTPGVFSPHINPNASDQVYRSQMIQAYLSDTTKDKSQKKKNVAPTPLDPIHNTSLDTTLRTAVHFYSMLQTTDGHWSGDYGGPHFLLPGLVIVWHCMGRPSHILSTDVHIPLMVHYIVSHQQTDGGWGTHLESPSTMFGTTLMYTALRLLLKNDTASKEQHQHYDHYDLDTVLTRGRAFVQDHGGVLYTSSWAKFYLCLLGVMDWEGHNSVPPEMWLLPNWCPFHPSRMWCHARMVYLPMGYLYGTRCVYDQAETDPIVRALRTELYGEDYDTIDWASTRHWVAPMDNYSPLPWTMAWAQNALACYERWSIVRPFRRWIRARGLQFCSDYMAAEDLQTNYIDIGPVNKVLNMLSAYHAVEGDLSHPTVTNHMVRVADYLWVAEDGMKVKGYNGSQCWDTSFAIQGIYEAGLVDAFPDVSKKVWSYLERCQILSTPESQATPAYRYETPRLRCRYYRHVSKGGWPFSTSAHGWPISDCTGEGLKGVLCLLKSQCIQDGIADGELLPIGDERLQDACNVLLSYQNEDGGFATYENCRGFGWYESLNPSEVFGDIMIDYSYVECSMASLTALAEFMDEYPFHRADEVRHALEKGRDFLKGIQRDDGSWYGSWACCFCYGTWFGVEGLVKCGEDVDSPSIQKACSYLLSHQRSNGGWGEDFTSCYDKQYAEDGMQAYGQDGSGVVNTAWALLALAAAKCSDTVAIRRGVRYLMMRQLPCGDWPQEGIAGVFNRACGITYTAYRNVFPIWALGRCQATYGTADLEWPRESPVQAYRLE